MNPIRLHSVLSENYITITWFVSSKCNYRCSYCIDSLNKGKTFPNNYKNAINFIKQIQDKYPDKTIRLFFMGGEISLWKQFYSFTKEVKRLSNIKITMISNGSFSLEWLKQNIEYLDFILISYHHQFASKEHFINISKLINHKGHVLLMLPHDKFDEVLDIGKQISEEGKIYVALKLLREGFRDKFYPYKEKDLKKGDTSFGYQHFPANCLTFTSGEILVEFDNDNADCLYNIKNVILRHYNHVKGWNCYGGIDNFFINDVGDIFVGQCRIGKFGNVFEDKITLPDKPFICTAKTCNCSIDLKSCNKIKGELWRQM